MLYIGQIRYFSDVGGLASSVPLLIDLRIAGGYRSRTSVTSMDPVETFNLARPLSAVQMTLQILTRADSSADSHLITPPR